VRANSSSIPQKKRFLSSFFDSRVLRPFFYAGGLSNILSRAVHCEMVIRELRNWVHV